MHVMNLEIELGTLKQSMSVMSKQLEEVTSMLTRMGGFSQISVA
eukprot:CAMPEP_0180664534 /NCGR_PEP_ID=MMETSP1037_2-20121125/60688_1 /TAXON_ID=632150 /ORGANISM="Azadinium spinosum, Strain 3D9" /LENGTH=43 /DNA_ID= /DNA_START= /DNA_END= /DNA_ORIENTATION=